MSALRCAAVAIIIDKQTEIADVDYAVAVEVGGNIIGVGVRGGDIVTISVGIDEQAKITNVSVAML